jgi:adenylate cyclase
MGQEIERKFLLRHDGWRPLAIGQLYRQGYIPTQGSQTVRLRVVGDRGFLTIKGPTEGFSRSEFEYEIPVAEAQEMLDHLCAKPLIEKYRHRITVDQWVWEVDEFLGANQGLILAEVELASESELPTIPDWIGEDVTGDRRYFNSYLVDHPFSSWAPEPISPS